MRLRRRWRIAGEQRGYTLVEMLVVLSILGVVMSGLTTLFVNASHAETDMNARFQAQQTARLALDKLRREVHCASGATPSGASSSITITLPTYCKTGSGSITWCTRSVATSRYALYRIAGTSCTGGVKWADYLTLQNVFNYSAPVSQTSLALLHVDLPVNVQPSRSAGAYQLSDDLVLRNTSR